METNYPPSYNFTETFPFTMAHPTSPTFETVFSISHYNMSAHTFAVHTLPLHWISAIINLLASDPALKWQLDEQHCLAAQQFSLLLTHQSASWIPQHIHDVKQPDCWHCWIWQWRPTPYTRQQSQSIVIHGSSSESNSSSSSSSSSVLEQYRQMPSYLC